MPCPVTDDPEHRRDGSIAPPIFTSVGQDAVNGPGDVFVIQSLLNRRLPQPHVDIPVTGAIDPGTILAIKTFQAVVMNMNPPSGHVAPASPTYYALAARPLVNKRPPPQIRFGHVGILPPEVIEAAKASQTRWGIPASVTLAQWIVESAWGSAMPPDSNNPFGIKALELAAGGGKRNPRSGRRQGGDHHRPVPALRQPGRSLRGSRQLLATAAPYQTARTFIQDPDRFADALTGVYATDPQYGERSSGSWTTTS